MIKKLIGIVMVIFALMYVLKDYFIVLVGIIILIIIIRFVADIYWWGKDNDQW